MSGSPMPRLITSMPASRFVRDLALELGEHVRRDRLEPLGGVGQGHRRGQATGASLGAAPRARDELGDSSPA